jgi:hypothetical protein
MKSLKRAVKCAPHKIIRFALAEYHSSQMLFIDALNANPYQHKPQHITLSTTNPLAASPSPLLTALN